MTYTLVQRNKNSWIQYEDGSRDYEIVDTCGHKHRSLAGAVKCRDKQGETWLTRLGQIEDANGVAVDSYAVSR